MAVCAVCRGGCVVGGEGLKWDAGNEKADATIGNATRIRPTRSHVQSNTTENVASESESSG
jgi:hypothetical protein